MLDWLEQQLKEDRQFLLSMHINPGLNVHTIDNLEVVWQKNATYRLN